LHEGRLPPSTLSSTAARPKTVPAAAWLCPTVPKTFFFRWRCTCAGIARAWLSRLHCAPLNPLWSPVLSRVPGVIVLLLCLRLRSSLCSRMFWTSLPCVSFPYNRLPALRSFLCFPCLGSLLLRDRLARRMVRFPSPRLASSAIRRIDDPPESEGFAVKFFTPPLPRYPHESSLFFRNC